MIDDSIAKKHSKFLVIHTGKTTDHIPFKIFPDTILLLKVDHFEGIINRIKVDGMVNDHSSRCNSKKSIQILLKKRLQLLATSTSTTIDAMALKIFPDTMQKTNSVKDL